MNVVLNCVYLVPGETGGMETYARELIPRLGALDVRLTALVSRAAARADLGCETVLVPVDSRSRVQWVRAEQQHVPRLAKRAGADLIHSLASTSPLWSAMPRVTTIHDLHYKLVPDAHFGVRGLGMRVLVPAAARRSRRIIAVSRQTADDLVAHLKLPAGRVDVVPNGVNQTPAVEPTPEGEVRARLGLGERPFLLSVSAKRPHKNLTALLDALALIPPERRPLLVVPGYPTPHEGELRARARRLQVDAVWPAWVSPPDLEGLYAAAAAFVFPSLYEGFGLPVLEAMARGLPVATSARGSLAEVAGDAALTFDPTDPPTIAAAIERLPDEREPLIAAGRAQAARFTWERSAELTRAAYERTLG